MFDSYGAFQARSIAPKSAERYNYGVVTVGKAVAEFDDLRGRALLKRWVGKLLGRSHDLLDLAETRRGRTVENMYEAGCVAVALAQIVGSEGRARDFDRDFLPLCRACRERWASVYAARLVGTPFPPVSLVGVGNAYFVRDGHHRVSVARLLGEQYIDASVQVWQLQGGAAPTPALSLQLVKAM